MKKLIVFMLLSLLLIGVVSASPVKEGNIASENVYRYQEQKQIRECVGNCTLEMNMNGSMLRETQRVRFLFFNRDAVIDYELNEAGEIVGHENNFWRWMYNVRLAKGVDV